MMRLIFIVLIMVAFNADCYSQVNSNKNESQVKLIKWSSDACDPTYDPYRLQNRITNLESKDGITKITVNFVDNCCAEFKPKIKFKNNKLMLISYYDKRTSDYEVCMCNCCFSINFEISGITSKNFEVYFNDKKVELSNNHYKTIEPSYIIYKGKKINQVNKYGFKEGIWVTFYEDSTQKSVTKYPETSLYRPSGYEWLKRYYQSGRLSYYHRKDSAESWFEDGELKSQFIDYFSGDTLFVKGFTKYENRQLQSRSLQKRYYTIAHNKLDSTYAGDGVVWDYIYNEEYYSNGQRKYLQGKDTSYAWFENGIIKFKSYESGSLEYNEQGRLIERDFFWKEAGIKGSGGLNYSLYIEYHENGDIRQIHFARDEPSKDGEGFASNVPYYWIWDKELNLIESPKNWKEDYPWKKITEINLLPTKYKGLLKK